MDSSQPQDATQSMTAQNVWAAVARTAARGLALYFSRPVRLFRPSKISGWQTLRARARSEGESLSPTYLLSLVRSQGFHVISHHFVPPLLINSALGTILWTSYSIASNELQEHIQSPVLASGLAGGIAGATQAVAAAPAENVRILLEGGAEHARWSEVWKSVFRASEDAAAGNSGHISRSQARHLREWVKEVRETAGHGWHGWHWTMAKDTCGFAAFFAIFEVSRQLAAEARQLARRLPLDSERPSGRHTERIAYAMTLVTGGAVAGFCYELVGRPIDNARYLTRLHHLSPIATTLPEVLLRKLHEDGPLSFFRDPHAHAVAPVYENNLKQRLYVISRTIARVGPWGVGFLAWEAFGQQ